MSKLRRVLTWHSSAVDSGVHVDIETWLGGGAVGAFLTTFVIGAILLAVVPEYTESRMAAVLEEPLDSLLYGIFALLALVVLIVLLVLSILGILFVIPLFFTAVLVWGVGAAIAFLAIADRLVDHEDGWLKPLLLAAFLNGGLALTGVGGIVAVAVGAAGFGAILRPYLDG